MKVALCLTHRCNLACDYCYAPRNADVMSLDTAAKAIGLALSQAKSGEEVLFQFQGGEPLLYFDLIQDIVRMTGCADSNNNPVSWELFTNGTLLSQEILNFMNKENIRLRMGFDGPARIHNRRRVYPTGIGSYALVLANLRRAVKQLREVASDTVFGPDTLDTLPETLDLLEREGLSHVVFHLDFSRKWPPGVEQAFERVYDRLASRYIELYRAGRILNLNLIDHKITLMLTGGYQRWEQDTPRKWAVAPNGDIYPCDQVIGKTPSLRMGSVQGGFREDHELTRLKQVGCANDACGSCSLSRYCRNRSLCANYLQMGDPERMSPVLCASEKAAIQAARRVFTTLFNQNNKVFVNHIAGSLEHAACTM